MSCLGGGGGVASDWVRGTAPQTRVVVPCKRFQSGPPPRPFNLQTSRRTTHYESFENVTFPLARRLFLFPCRPPAGSTRHVDHQGLRNGHSDAFAECSPFFTKRVRLVARLELGAHSSELQPCRFRAHLRAEMLRVVLNRGVACHGACSIV